MVKKYACVSFTKAFNRVKHTKVVKRFKEIEVDDKDLQIITELCCEQTEIARTDSGLTSNFNIKKGVGQVCTFI